jgi:hypothetical protein
VEDIEMTNWSQWQTPNNGFIFHRRVAVSLHEFALNVSVSVSARCV